MRARSLILLSLAACACSRHAERAEGVDQVTVPLVIEGNRPFVELTFHRANGSPREARFLVDSGGGGFLMTETLARDVGIEWGKTSREEGAVFGRAKTPPDASIGEFPLALEARRVLVLVGADNALPLAAPGHADGVLPGHVLARYHVVFDYPRGTFTLARRGVIEPRGSATPMPVSKQQGFPRTELEVDGITYGFLLDTGASFTMVSEALLRSWGATHPEWERHAGAVGEAATLGGQTLETMVVPTARWGNESLSDLGVVSQREGTFERYMSDMMVKPVMGSLAGNALKNFRVELDYPDQMLYLSAP